MNANKSRTLLLGIVVVALTGMPAAACTGIRLTAQDGAVVCARTLEFGTDLESNVIVVPRGKEYVGSTSSKQPGLRWTTKYGAAGANAFGLPVIVDGVNERGLGLGLFYFPGYAKYQPVEPDQAGDSLAPWELGTYLLSTCADVAEAKAAVARIRVGAVVQENFGFVPPCHYVVHDAAGNCAAIEYVDGVVTVHDEPLGVFTNSPTIDWHLTNLRNYVNLKVDNVPAVELDGVRLSGFGQGNGLVGLPGDFTSPARFVRATAFSQSAVPCSTGRDAVLSAFHILNQFDIPKGAVRSTDDGQQHDEYTLWTSASDLAARRYFFHTYANRQIRMVELSKLDLDAADVKTISMSGDESIADVTDSAR